MFQKSSSTQTISVVKQDDLTLGLHGKVPHLVLSTPLSGMEEAINTPIRMAMV